jgi:hypothetical protein
LVEDANANKGTDTRKNGFIRKIVELDCSLGPFEAGKRRKEGPRDAGSRSSDGSRRNPENSAMVKKLLLLPE